MLQESLGKEAVEDTKTQIEDAGKKSNQYNKLSCKKKVGKNYIPFLTSIIYYINIISCKV